MCASVLAFESIVLVLTTPVLITVADVDPAPALGMGIGLAVLAIVAAGLLRRPIGHWLGHAVQVGTVGMGVVLPVMLFLGGVFAGLWVLARVLGRRVDAARAA